MHVCNVDERDKALETERANMDPFQRKKAVRMAIHSHAGSYGPTHGWAHTRARRREGENIH